MRGSQTALEMNPFDNQCSLAQQLNRFDFNSEITLIHLAKLQKNHLPFSSDKTGKLLLLGSLNSPRNHFSTLLLTGIGESLVLNTLWCNTRQ